MKNPRFPPKTNIWPLHRKHQHLASQNLRKLPRHASHLVHQEDAKMMVSKISCHCMSRQNYCFSNLVFVNSLNINDSELIFYPDEDPSLSSQNEYLAPSPNTPTVSKSKAPKTTTPRQSIGPSRSPSQTPHCHSLPLDKHRSGTSARPSSSSSSSDQRRGSSELEVEGKHNSTEYFFWI